MVYLGPLQPSSPICCGDDMVLVEGDWVCVWCEHSFSFLAKEEEDWPPEYYLLSDENKQRASFAYGNAKLSNKNVTKQMAIDAVISRRRARSSSDDSGDNNESR